MAEAREITGLSREWITRRAAAGDIPGAIKRSGKTSPWFFTKAGLNEFLGIHEEVA